jgi:hypothetical protein
MLSEQAFIPDLIYYDEIPLELTDFIVVDHGEPRQLDINGGWISNNEGQNGNE